jgi:large subunit ribosomal protein L18
MLEKTLKRLRRKVRVRSQIHGTAECPRLSVFRSNTGIYAQVIDDDKGVTLAAYSDLKLEKTGTKTNSATTV